jgi:NADPH2:quinone reductase
MKRPGGPETLDMVDWPEPVLGPGQALVEVATAGVNFMDTGVRRGLFWTEMPDPKVIGVEGAGRVLAVGDKGDSVQPRQRIATVASPKRQFACPVARVCTSSTTAVRAERAPASRDDHPYN